MHMHQLRAAPTLPSHASYQCKEEYHICLAYTFEWKRRPADANTWRHLTLYILGATWNRIRFARLQAALCWHFRFSRVRQFSLSQASQECSGKTVVASLSMSGAVSPAASCMQALQHCSAQEGQPWCTPLMYILSPIWHNSSQIAW